MEWKTHAGLLQYPDALAVMAARVLAIQNGEADELAWLVEHPPLYTLGTSAKAVDVLGQQFPTYETGRGGQVTYHGPGQRVVYLMLDLKKRAATKGAEPDLRAYVKQLEQWIILTLAVFGIEGFTRDGRVGVWVDQPPVTSRQSPNASRQSQVINEGATCAVVPLPLRERLGEGALHQNASPSTPLTQPSPAVGEGLFGAPSAQSTTHYSPRTTREAKIAALGVRVQKWVTSHGIAINVHPDLSHYAGIVPCGIREFGVTSLAALGVDATMDAVDAVLKESYARVFG